MLEPLDFDAGWAEGYPTIVLRSVMKADIRLMVVEYVNDPALQLLHREKYEILGCSIADVLSEEHRYGAVQRLALAGEAGENLKLLVCVRSTTNSIPVVLECQPMKRMLGYLALRVQRLQDLQRNQIDQDHIIDDIHSVKTSFKYWMAIGASGRLELSEIDPKLVDKIGYPKEEILSKGLENFSEPRIRPTLARRYSRLVMGQSVRLQYHIEAADSTIISTLDFAAPVFVEDRSEPVGVAGRIDVLSELTKLNGPEISASDMVSSIEHLIDQDFWISDGDGKIILSSSKRKEFTKYPNGTLSPIERAVLDANARNAHARQVIRWFALNLENAGEIMAANVMVIPQSNNLSITIIEPNNQGYQRSRRFHTGMSEISIESHQNLVITMQIPIARALPPDRTSIWIDASSVIVDFNEAAKSSLSPMQLLRGQELAYIVSNRLAPQFVSDALAVLHAGAASVSFSTTKNTGKALSQIATRIVTDTNSLEEELFQASVDVSPYRASNIAGSTIEYLEIFANSIAVGVANLDEDFRFFWFNKRTAEILQIDPISLIGRKIEDCFIVSPKTSLTLTQLIEWSISENSSIQNLLIRYHENELVPVEVSVRVLELWGKSQYILTINDITLLRHSEETIRSLAYYDGLTGLPNRILFHERLSHAIERARRERHSLTLMILDLSGFGIINDSLGLERGDELLRRVGERLRSTLRSSDTVARLSGDDFTILLYGAESAPAAVQVAKKLLDCFSRPFRLNGHEISINANLGITVYPGDGEDGEALIRNANAALAKAKGQGSGHYQFFTRDMNDIAFERVILAGNLRRALEEKQFETYYQPIVDVAELRIVGFEALLRWFHPDHGQISPALFVPLAEDTGLIHNLGRFVLDQACRDLRRWHELGFQYIRAAVNVSGRQVQDWSFPEIVRDVLAGCGVDGHHLELELTESIMLEAAASQLTTIKRLRDIGVSLSIDDFGTGYSSFRYLQEFPVQCLKIDRSLIVAIEGDSGAESSRSGTAIAHAIVTLGHGLNMRIVAEGIETAAQFRAIRQLGCDQAQGFFFGKPEPFERTIELLETDFNQVVDGI